MPAKAGFYRRSGRQDLNLRPPGPQPGALPDCATPRGYELRTCAAKRATGLEPAPRAWKAPVQPLTPRPEGSRKCSGLAQPQANASPTPAQPQPRPRDP